MDLDILEGTIKFINVGSIGNTLQYTTRMARKEGAGRRGFGIQQGKRRKKTRLVSNIWEFKALAGNVGE